jgi:hypothetical protein
MVPVIGGDTNLHRTGCIIVKTNNAALRPADFVIDNLTLPNIDGRARNVISAIELLSGGSEDPGVSRERKNDGDGGDRAEVELHFGGEELLGFI